MTNASSTYWFIFYKDQLVLAKQGDSLCLPNESIFNINELKLAHRYLLGSIDQLEVFCAEIPADESLPAGLPTIPLRKALDVIGEEWYSMATKAYAIVNWDKNHQFCGKCGGPTIHNGGIFERVCQQCSQAFYPRISPSVIVLIQRGDTLLMARSPHFSPGVYALIAGFVEAGESLEETVHREVAEEVGIHINNLRYFGSQSWPFPDSLMIGFIADYASGELQIDPSEIEDAGWYRYDQLPGRPSNKISISSKLIDHFIHLNSSQKMK